MANKTERPKDIVRKEVEDATKKYLANGGTITRFEKWGKVTILKQTLDGDLNEVNWFDTVEAYENSR